MTYRPPHADMVEQALSKITKTPPLIERMRTQLHVWEDEEPYSDWWTYQREYGEAFEILQLFANALEFYAYGIGYTEIEDGGATARTALGRLYGDSALAAGTRSAETGETPAQSEGCQSGPKGNAQGDPS